MSVSAEIDLGAMAETDYLDLSHLQNQAPTAVSIGSRRGWLAAEVDPRDCVISLRDEGLAEIDEMTAAMARYPLPLLLRRPAHFEMRALAAVMAQVQERLANGTGVAVIDALPLDRLDSDAAKAVFWVLGQLLGQPVAQKWDGTMLYDVMDKGQQYSYGVRGSYTNVELLFHTDNAFAVLPPEYVALLCIRPALEGGVSRFCSISAVHNRMLEDYPDELERLYRCVLWDRQAEHATGAPKITKAPVFRFHEGELSARLNVSLIRKGYDVAGVAMDSETRDAVAALEEVADSPELWFELPIERGQLQFLNNQSIAHYRSEFRDDENPARKRHLVRTWHRDQGLPTYDG